MTGRRWWPAWALVALSLAAGCRKQEGDPDAARRAAAGAPTDSLSPRPTCPQTGRWDLCTLRDRLEDAGLVPQTGADSVVRHPFMSVPGVRMTLGRSELQAFFYESAEAMRRDVDKLDSASASPSSAPVMWAAPPTLIPNANLAAILVGGNATHVERIQNAILAGPPQPPQ